MKLHIHSGTADHSEACMMACGDMRVQGGDAQLVHDGQVERVHGHVHVHVLLHRRRPDKLPMRRLPN